MGSVQARRVSVCVCACGVSLVIEINSAKVEVGNNGLFFLSIVQFTESYTCTCCQ